MAKQVLAVAAVVVAAVLCAACRPSAPKIEFKFGETRGRLGKNGLRFVIMPDQTTRLVEVDVRYEVGSREDPPGKAGLAHLVEHLMFQQRPDGPDTPPLMQVLQQVVLSVNAYTTWDSTHYMLGARAEVMDALIKAEAVRMHDGCRSISENEFLREREVVRNEIRGRNRSAEGQIPRLALASIYPKGHAYAQVVGGDDAQLSSITLRDACEFLEQYYVPERATVLIAGGITTAAAIGSIEQWFNLLPRRTPAPRRVVEPVRVAKAQTTVELELERPWVTVAWALPDARTPEGAAAEFGIWRAFFDTLYLANKFECATQGFPAKLGGREAPVFLIALELKSMSALDQCLGFVKAAARDAHRGWGDGLWEQIEEGKNRSKAAFIASLEPLFGIGGRTDQLGDLVQFTRDFDFDSRGLYAFHELDRIGKLDLDAVSSAVKRALDVERARVVVFKPSKAGGTGDRRSTVAFETRSHDSVVQPEVDPAEARRPVPVPTEAGALAGAVRFELGNGMRVVLLPVSSMPVIAAQLVFEVGAAATPSNPALAWAAANLLSPPPGSTVLGETGVRMRCDTTPDHTICGARGMSIYLDVVIKAFERLIKVGGYSQRRVEDWQQARRNELKLRRPQQRLEFERQQLAAIFGPDHPYTRTGAIAPGALGGVGSDALLAFRDRHYSAANATLVIAGALDPKHAEALIRDAFGDWSRGHKDAPVPRAPVPRTGPTYVGVIGDGDPQVDVAILYPSQPGMGGQEAARRVLTAMLNEQMSAIRARLGATYGTRARRDARLGPSAYELGGAVDAPRAGEALQAMRDGVDALRRDRAGQGVAFDFDAAFVRARRAVIQSLLGESTMSAELATRLGAIARFGLDPQYYSGLLRQASAVSPVQVKELIARELDPAGEVIVTLGDRASVAKAFADAGLADVKLIEPSYK